MKKRYASFSFDINSSYLTPEFAQRQEAAAELQGWAAAAQRRTEAFLQQGPQGPVTWVYSGALDSNRGLLNDLITGGDEGGQPWYIARSPHEVGCDHSFAAF